MSDLATRLRSTDFVTRAAADAELGRALIAHLDHDPVDVGHVGGLLTGELAEVQRAIVDMTSADVPGLAHPGFVRFPAVPTLPFLALCTDLVGVVDGIDNTSTVRLPSVTSLPTGVLDPAEKTSVATSTKLTGGAVDKAVHLAACAVDVSIAALTRTDTGTVDVYGAICGLVVTRLLEGAIVADVVAASTSGTGTTAADVPGAIGQASAAWAPVDVILVGTAAYGKIVAAFPMGLGVPLTVVASSAFSSKVLVTNRSNLIAMASPLRSLAADQPMLLGRDVGVWEQGVGGVVAAPGSVVLTLA